MATRANVRPTPATGLKAISGPKSVPEPYHVYHAEAHILTGNLIHPLRQQFEDDGRIVLENTRREDHVTRSLGATTLENLISFTKGYTSVSGSQLKNKRDVWGHEHSGWVTLATSVIEGLNIFEVITADRLVAQVSTEHSRKNSHVPAVTFLGTRFENLKICGVPIEVELDLHICGGKPAKHRSYVEDPGFLSRVKSQLQRVTGAKGLPETLKKEYADKIASLEHSRLQCSLVKSIKPIPIPGVKTFGHIIYIPDFGTVSLAEVEVGIEDNCVAFGNPLPARSDSNYFTLKMLDIHMGSIGGGSFTSGKVKANGQSYP